MANVCRMSILGWIRCWVLFCVWVFGGVAGSETVWHDARTLTVEGQGWEKVDAPFQRLPSHARGRVPDSVWGLSRSSAGLVVRFLTRAERIDVRWDLTEASLAMPHMPATGVSGIDLYARDPGNKAWRFVQNGRPTGQSNNLASFRVARDPILREFLLYLPLYNGVSRLEVGVDSAVELMPATFKRGTERRPVVVYGTSIVQGGCASRPGMAYPAILGRMLDRSVINLGFSGAGRMESGVVEVVAELDPAIFVIDCLWNLSGEKPEEVRRRVHELIAILRRHHPTTPIVLVGQSEIHPERHPTAGTSTQEAVVREWVRRGDRRLRVVPGIGLLGGDGEGTVDGVHPNDLGMQRQAEVMAPMLSRWIP
jgi:lysophospholipase L1-like esterase